MIPLTIEIIKKSVKKVEMIKKSRNSKLLPQNPVDIFCSRNPTKKGRSKY